MEKNIPNISKRRRRLPRWSMMSMFVMVTIVCLVLGLVVRPVEQQKRSVEALLSIGHGYNHAEVYYDYEYDRNRPRENLMFEQTARPTSAPPGPPWLRELIGVDYFANVVRVDLVDGFRVIAHSSIASGSYDPPSPIHDNDVRHVRHFGHLQALYLTGTGVTDQGVNHFASLRRLRHLDLSLTRITDVGLAKMARLTRLQTLGLVKTNVSNDGLSHLHDMTELETLGLAGTKVSDDGLRHLAKMDKLTSLYLTGTNVTQQGVDTLQAVLPNCEIDWSPSADR